jgi:hypothetical protein
LLKRYQGFIDQLHARASRSEQAFLQLYGKLSVIADPVPLLAQLVRNNSTFAVPLGAADTITNKGLDVNRVDEELRLLKQRELEWKDKVDKARCKRQAAEEEVLEILGLCYFLKQTSLLQLRKIRLSMEDLESTSRAALRECERREAELERERDQALQREEVAKKERDEMVTRSFNMSQLVDESPSPFELALESRQASLYVLEGRDAGLREQIAVSKQDVAQKEVEIVRLREQLGRLEESRETLCADLLLERNARAQAEKSSLACQQELRLQGLKWEEERRNVLRDVEQLRQARVVVAPPVIVAPPVAKSSPAIPAGTRSPIFGDSLAMLLRYRPARVGLIVYLALVHIMFIMILYMHSTEGVRV